MATFSITGPDVAHAVQACGFTHVVWIPDSHLGTWEEALLSATSLTLIRAAREGEALAIAAGLLLGGAKPIVLIQCTGLFEAGDALRNIVHDLNLPLLLIVGVRSYLAMQQGKSNDNCATFSEPIVQAWKIPYHWIDPTKMSANDLIQKLRQLQRSNQAGLLLWAE